MAKLVYLIATTVDGKIASPEGDFGFFPMGDHVEALAEHYPETLPVHVRTAMQIEVRDPRFSTVLMGRKTYEVGLAHGITDPYAPLKTFVWSRTLPADRYPIQITQGDPTELIRRLKQQSGGDIWLCGGGQLAQALVDEIDEWIIKLNPVIVGDGLPLLAGPYRVRPLQLESISRFESGVVWLHYTRGETSA